MVRVRGYGLGLGLAFRRIGFQRIVFRRIETEPDFVVGRWSGVHFVGSGFPN